MSSKTDEEIEFDWIQLNKDVRRGQSDETTKERMLRKIKENPFVPIGQNILINYIQCKTMNIKLIVGCLATFSALSYGLWSFRTGQRKMSQYMMRTRIAAQGFTVLALIIGIGIGAKAAKQNTIPFQYRYIFLILDNAECICIKNKKLNNQI